MGGGRSKHRSKINNLQQTCNELSTRNQQVSQQVSALKQELNYAKSEVDRVTKLLELPAKQRAEKVKFVNNLELKIRQVDKPALVGPKGFGKSTFIWLLQKGNKPSTSHSDGTVNVVYGEHFIDSIGIPWSLASVLKLTTIFIYEGFPSDLIVFSNDRVMHPITILGQLGVISPIVVMLRAGLFWDMYNGDEFKLIANEKGIRMIEPKRFLKYVYNARAYEDLKQLNLCYTLTHHDDLDEVLRTRKKYDFAAFSNLLEMFGNTFQAPEKRGVGSQQAIIEQLFMFIYIYEKKYKKDQLEFLNKAVLEEFYDDEKDP